MCHSARSAVQRCHATGGCARTRAAALLCPVLLRMCTHTMPRVHAMRPRALQGSAAVECGVARNASSSAEAPPGSTQAEADTQAAGQAPQLDVAKQRRQQQQLADVEAEVDAQLAAQVRAFRARACKARQPRLCAHA